MKRGVLLVLIILVFSIYSVDAVLIWKEDFEDQVYSDTFFTQMSDISCAAGSGYAALDITNYQSQNGFYSLRFDACSVATDSVTGLNGCNDVDLYIGNPSTGAIGTIHDLITPVESTDEIYVKYWTKYDSITPLNEEILIVDWFRFPENGFVAFDRNSPSFDPLSAYTYESFVLNDYANPLPSIDVHDGLWHKVEFYVNYNYNGLGEASIQGWIDDVLALDWQGPVINGRPDYVRLHRFLGGASGCTSTPIQIDDIEIWNEIPSLTQCANGLVSSLCECGGSARDYGYCWNDEWSTSSLAPCIINDAYWGTTNVDMGTQVNLIVQGSDCDGKQIDFQILEHDSVSSNYEDVTSQLSNLPSSTTFSGSTATISWIAEWVEDTGFLVDSDPEYVFNVSLNENPSTFMLSNNELSVNFVLGSCSYGAINVQCDCGGTTYNPGDGYCCGGSFDVNPCPIITDDAVLYLPLDSDYQDHSVNGVSITCTDCPTQTTGQINGAYNFNGVSNYLDFGSLDVTGSEITMAAWINSNDASDCGSRIISKAISTSEQDHYWMLGTCTNQLRMRLKSNGVTNTFIAGSITAAEGWVHVAATYDGTTMILYKNGIPIGSQAHTTPGTVSVNPSVFGWVGGNPTPVVGSYFNGLLDDVRVYDRSLDQTEIQAIMAGITLTSCGDGIIQLPNQEGSGGPLNDGYESCDLTDLGGNNCILLGYDGGSPLSCNGDCTFDVTNCYYFSCTDGDGDGYNGYDATYCPSGNDCDDSNEFVNPTGEAGYCDCVGTPDVEVCGDIIDQDCNGVDLVCPNPDDVIIDNGDAGTSYLGSWSSSTYWLNHYGANYMYSIPETQSGLWYQWATTLNPGQYEVYTWWTDASDRPYDVNYTITGISLNEVSNIDQRINGGQWNLLGTYDFDGISSVRVITGSTGAGGTCADAVRFLKIGNLSSECTIDSDCNYLDLDYCSGTQIMHDEGICNLNACEVSTSLTQDCDDGLFCNGDESCNAASCVAGTAPVINDGVSCTLDSCDETNNIVVNTPTDSLCDDGLSCTGVETCDALLDCQTGSNVDCSSNNILGVSTCTNTPDGNPLTWDFRTALTSTCQEPSGVCTTGDSTITSTCDAVTCSAECELNSDCLPTNCDVQDGCVGNDYYDYTNVDNNCLSGCTCETNSCGAPTITANSPLCVACTVHDDCNDLDSDFCFGTEVRHTEGVCNAAFECEAQTNTVEDCYWRSFMVGTYLQCTVATGDIDVYGNEWGCNAGSCIDLGIPVILSSQQICNDACGVVAGLVADQEDCYDISQTTCPQINYPQASCNGQIFVEYSCSGTDAVNTTTDCDSLDGWYPIVGPPSTWVPYGDCTEKEQIQETYYDYTCYSTGCSYGAGGIDWRWVDTGNTRNVVDGTTCDDGLSCTENDQCISGSCGGSTIDCSSNNILGVSTCTNTPDGNPLTWDFRTALTSTCQEPSGVCTTGDSTITSTCDAVTCSAECELNSDCLPTNCDVQDGCVGNDYYDYTNVDNNCLSGCTCETNSCGAPTITANSPLCVACTVHDDCNDLDSDFCFGTEVRHTEGVCNAAFECEAQTNTVEDCSAQDNSYCSGTNVVRDIYTCNLAICELSQTMTEQTCNDGLFCNGDESCNAASCVPGTAPVINDGVSCTLDSCDETNNIVVNTPTDSLCDDGNINTLDTCDAVDDCSFTPITSTMNQTIALNSGWNLVNVWVNTTQTSNSLDSVFVMSYENNNWIIDWGSISGDEFLLEPLKGYYVYSTTDKMINLIGQSLPSPYRHELVSNTWDLFSTQYSSTFNVLYSDLSAHYGLYQVNEFSGNLDVVQIQDDDVLNPTNLYWINLRGPEFGPPFGSFFQGLIDAIAYLFTPIR